MRYPYKQKAMVLKFTQRPDESSIVLHQEACNYRYSMTTISEPSYRLMPAIYISVMVQPSVG
jgi:hypothetical protein